MKTKLKNILNKYADEFSMSRLLKVYIKRKNMKKHTLS